MNHLLSCTLIAMSALAATQMAYGDVIFECTTTDGDILKLGETADKVQYSFGKPNRPELRFEADIITALYTSFENNGGFATHYVTLNNQGTTYEVFSTDYGYDDSSRSGVSVHDAKHRILTEILCHPDKIRTNRLAVMGSTTQIPYSP